MHCSRLEAASSLPETPYPRLSCSHFVGRNALRHLGPCEVQAQPPESPCPFPPAPCGVDCTTPTTSATALQGQARLTLLPPTTVCHGNASLPLPPPSSQQQLRRRQRRHTEVQRLPALASSPAAAGSTYRRLSVDTLLPLLGAPSASDAAASACAPPSGPTSRDTACEAEEEADSETDALFAPPPASSSPGNTLLPPPRPTPARQPPKSSSGVPSSLPHLDWMLPQLQPRPHVQLPEAAAAVCAHVETSARSLTAPKPALKSSVGHSRRRSSILFAVPLHQAADADAADHAEGQDFAEQELQQLQTQRSSRSFTAADVQQLRDAAAAAGRGRSGGSGGGVLKSVLSGLGVWSSKMGDVDGPLVVAAPPALPAESCAAGSGDASDASQAFVTPRVRACGGSLFGEGAEAGAPRRLGPESTAPLLGADATTHIMRTLSRLHCRW